MENQVMTQDQVKQLVEEGMTKDAPVHTDDGFAETAAAIQAVHDEVSASLKEPKQDLVEVTMFPFSEDDKWALGQNYLEHVLTKDQATRLNHIRHVMFEAACEIAKYTPKCAQQTLSLRQLEMAGMWATKAILVTEEK